MNKSYFHRVWMSGIKTGLNNINRRLRITPWHAQWMWGKSAHPNLISDRDCIRRYLDRSATTNRPGGL